MKKNKFNFNLKNAILVSLGIHAFALSSMFVSSLLEPKNPDLISINIEKEHNTPNAEKSDSPYKDVLEIGSVDNAKILNRMKEIESEKSAEIQRREALRQELDMLAGEKEEYNQSLSNLKKEQETLSNNIRAREQELQKKEKELKREQDRIDELRRDKQISQTEYDKLQQELEAKKKSDELRRQQQQADRERLERQQQARSIYEKQLGAYVSEIRDTLYNNWNFPPTAEPEWTCIVRFSQTKERHVENIQFNNNCHNNQDFKNSIVEAINRSSPLPTPITTIRHQDINEIELIFTIQ
jgi:myosin heavy subunit